MGARVPSTWSAYGAAALGVGLAAGARVVFDPLLGAHAPYLTFFMALAVAT